MKLEDFFSLHHINVSAWAKSYNISLRTLHLIKNGYVPSLETALKIAIATHGDVLFSDLAVGDQSHAYDLYLEYIDIEKIKNKKR